MVFMPYMRRFVNIVFRPFIGKTIMTECVCELSRSAGSSWQIPLPVSLPSVWKKSHQGLDPACKHTDDANDDAAVWACWIRARSAPQRVRNANRSMVPARKVIAAPRDCLSQNHTAQPCGTDPGKVLPV